MADDDEDRVLDDNQHYIVIRVIIPNYRVNRAMGISLSPSLHYSIPCPIYLVIIGIDVAGGDGGGNGDGGRGQSQHVDDGSDATTAADDDEYEVGMGFATTTCSGAALKFIRLTKYYD